MADKTQTKANGILAKICIGLNFLGVAVLVADFCCRCAQFAKKDHTGASLAPKNPFYYLLTIYLIPVALLALAAELQWRPMLKYIMFLKSQAGRGFFFIFVGLLIFDTNYPTDLSFGIYITIVGLFNIVCAWLIPAIYHLKWLKQDLYSE